MTDMYFRPNSLIDCQYGELHCRKCMKWENIYLNEIIYYAIHVKLISHMLPRSKNTFLVQLGYVNLITKLTCHSDITSSKN